ncbi:MAG: hemerythrin family protein [Bacteroidales bacterium]|nr:hemerythrin family protein [Bacteroidales bacterium]
MLESSLSALNIPETHITEIDKQYQKIKLTIEQVNACIIGGGSMEKLSPIFYSLVYIYDHYFTQEQITLAKYKFDKLETIKKVHRNFIDEVISYQKKIENHQLDSCSQLAEFLNQWAVGYFNDNQIAVSFLKAKGVN